MFAPNNISAEYFTESLGSICIYLSFLETDVIVWKTFISHEPEEVGFMLEQQGKEVM